MIGFIQERADSWKQYVVSTVIVLAVSLLCFGLTEYIGYRVVALVLLVTVSIIAGLFNLLPVLLSATLSAFIWDFFFIPPRFLLHVRTSEDAILLTMYFVIVLVNGLLTYKIRRIEKAARLKEERANSVKLYNTILNSLSHETRTPIAAIIASTDNLISNTNLTEADKTQLLHEISKASLRLNQQVENLLNISRLESGHIQPKADWCDVGELIYDVVQRVEEKNHKNKVNISINPSMPLCYVDSGMLDQVLYNLVNNAAFHNPENTDINISAISIADLLEIVVEDNGVGFQSTEMKDAFVKFSREHSSKNSGRGLGLSIVKGFTEAMGGTVSLENSIQGGAKFTVIIPTKVSALNLQHE